MSEVKLGELIVGFAERDAVHVAVAPVVAGEDLEPGSHVGLDMDGNALSQPETRIGIVDPFLRRTVDKGQKFYLFLYPNTVTGMRHHWRHPAFPTTPTLSEKDEHERWITEFAEDLGMSFEMLMDYTKHTFSRGDYIMWQHGDEVSYDGEECRDEWYGRSDEFWRRYEALTGHCVPEDDRGGFTCSC